MWLVASEALGSYILRLALIHGENPSGRGRNLFG